MSTTATTPLSAQQLADMADEFFREGSALVPNVFSAEEVAALRAKTDEYALNPDPKSRHTSYAANAFVLRYCHEIDPLFAAATTKPSVLAIAEAVLGANPRFNAMNVIRNEPGQAISRWHVDDVLEFPLPPDIPRFDARIRMPVLWFTIQVALSDIDTEAHGPTQYVPTSHYSGRKPPESLIFEGQGPKSIYCKAGDAYLTNHQTWHRGAPNTSDRTRYVMQLQYGTLWADRRFKGFG